MLWRYLLITMWFMIVTCSYYCTDVHSDSKISFAFRFFVCLLLFFWLFYLPVFDLKNVTSKLCQHLTNGVNVCAWCVTECPCTLYTSCFPASFLQNKIITGTIHLVISATYWAKRQFPLSKSHQSVVECDNVSVTH